MPHPSEVVKSLNETANRIVSPQTSKIERRVLLKQYREDLAWTLGRLEQIQTQFLTFIAQYPDAGFADVLVGLSSLDLDEGELAQLESVFAEFHGRRQARNQALEFCSGTAVGVLASLTQAANAGKVALIDLPFAIGLKFYDKRDLDTLEGGVDVAARYIDAQEISPGLKKTPVIFLGPSKDDHSQIHEETHGIHAAIYAGLEPQGMAEELWGGDIGDETTLQDLLMGAKPGDAELIRMIEKLLPRILANAKDEVIAFYNAESNFSVALDVLWQERVRSGSFAPEDNMTYDYFGSLGLTPELFSQGHQREIYNQLVDQFDQTLLINVGFLRRLWGLVHYDGGQVVSKDELLAFMRFTPLTLWQKVGRHVFAGALERLQPSLPYLEREMQCWHQLARDLEDEYLALLVMPNCMSFDTYTRQCMKGTAEIKKIAAPGRKIIHQIEKLQPGIEHTIGQMRDISLKHDLFDRMRLAQLEQDLQALFFKLVPLRAQLEAYVIETLPFDYKS